MKNRVFESDEYSELGSDSDSCAADFHNSTDSSDSSSESINDPSTDQKPRYTQSESDRSSQKLRYTGDSHSEFSPKNLAKRRRTSIRPKSRANRPRTSANPKRSLPAMCRRLRGSIPSAGERNYPPGSRARKSRPTAKAKAQLKIVSSAKNKSTTTTKKEKKLKKTKKVTNPP